MICPVCGEENLQGVDNCENCGADLRTADIPHPGTGFEARLVAEPLAALDSFEPVIVAESTPVADAIRLMQDRRVDYVLVQDGERLVGIFTERDALLKVAGRPVDGVLVGEVMTRDPVVLRGQDNLAVAIHKMAVGGFRHIPLVRDGKAEAVLSARDLFRHIITVLDQPRS